MALAIVLGTAITQAVRAVKAGGMGLPLFEGLGLIVAAVGSINLSGPVASTLHMQKSTVLIVIFLILGIGAFIAGRWLFTITSWSFESFDGLLGFLFGVAGGWAVANVVLRVIMESQGVSGPVATMMGNSLIAREIYEFRAWNWLVRLLFRARLSPEFDPDVG